MSTRPQPCSECFVSEPPIGDDPAATPTLSLGPGGRDSGASDSVSTEALKLVGRTLEGRYEVLKIIGAGGMGVVFEARHRFTGGRVALKLLNPCLGHAPCLREAFYREVRLLGRLDHPNVCTAYDLGHTDEGYPFVVLPLLKGRHLADWLDSSPDRFSWGRIVEVFTQILHGVVAIHDAGVVHGDLKPGNLWLGRLPDGREQVTIIDFGIASTLAADRRGGRGRGSGHSVVGGTPRYMAPERLQGETRPDRRQDVFSLGVVLLDLLTAETTGDLCSRRTKRGIRTMAPRWSRLADRVDAPAQLYALVARSLAYIPAHRYPSTRVLRHAFLNVAHDVGSSKSEPALVGPDEQQRLAG